MENSACEILLQYQPSRSEAEKLHSTYIACSAINAFSSCTATTLNSVTINALRKVSPMEKSLKTLLLSLAASDLGVGLLVQPFLIGLIVLWLQQNNPTCTTYTAFTIIMSLFSFASFFSVTLAKCRQILGHSSSSQIPGTCNSQKSAFCYNRNLDSQCIYFVNYAVDPTDRHLCYFCSYRGYLSCSYNVFQLQNLFGCSSSHKPNPSSSSTRNRREQRNGFKSC